MERFYLSAIAWRPHSRHKSSVSGGRQSTLLISASIPRANGACKPISVRAVTLADIMHQIDSEFHPFRGHPQSGAFVLHLCCMESPSPTGNRRETARNMGNRMQHGPRRAGINL